MLYALLPPFYKRMWIDNKTAAVDLAVFFNANCLYSFSQDCSLLSVSLALEALLYWCALQEALHKCINTLQYNELHLFPLRSPLGIVSLRRSCHPLLYLQSRRRMWIWKRSCRISTSCKDSWNRSLSSSTTYERKRLESASFWCRIICILSYSLIHSGNLYGRKPVQLQAKRNDLGKETNCLCAACIACEGALCKWMAYHTHFPNGGPITKKV